MKEGWLYNAEAWLNDSDMNNSGLESVSQDTLLQTVQTYVQSEMETSVSVAFVSALSQGIAAAGAVLAGAKLIELTVGSAAAGLASNPITLVCAIVIGIGLFIYVLGDLLDWW